MNSLLEPYIRYSTTSQGMPMNSTSNGDPETHATDQINCTGKSGPISRLKYLAFKALATPNEIHSRAMCYQDDAERILRNRWTLAYEHEKREYDRLRRACDLEFGRNGTQFLECARQLWDYATTLAKALDCREPGYIHASGSFLPM